MDTGKVIALTKRMIKKELSDLGPYHYVGTVANVNELPLTANVGDVYNVGDTSEGSNYAWNGTVWDKLGGGGGNDETTIEHSMSLLTEQIVPQMMGGNQYMTSSVQIYSETDCNKWLANPADPSISPVTVVSYMAPESVEFFPIDVSLLSFQPYGISAKVYLPDSQNVVQTYNPNASQHRNRPEPVPFNGLIPAYWPGMDGLAEDNPSNFYFCLDYNEEINKPIFYVVEIMDNTLQSIVTVNGVTATAQVDLSDLNGETITNIFNAINAIDAKLKDNNSNYSSLPEFEAYLKNKYGLIAKML